MPELGTWIRCSNSGTELGTRILNRIYTRSRNPRRTLQSDCRRCNRIPRFISGATIGTCIRNPSSEPNSGARIRSPQPATLTGAENLNPLPGSRLTHQIRYRNSAPIPGTRARHPTFVRRLEQDSGGGMSSEPATSNTYTEPGVGTRS